MGWHREIEIKEFTNWINSIFRHAWKLQRIDDVFEDMRSGVLLLYLTETLLCTKLPIINKKPANVTQRIENIELSLEALRYDGVDMPGILAQDIADGDEEVILAFCCFLKRHYAPSVLSNGIKSSDADLSCGAGFEITNKQLVSEQTSEDVIYKSPILHSPTRDEKVVVGFSYQEVGFIPFVKEDVAVLDWVSSMTGRFVEEYSAFKDGVILCELINGISLRTIPQKIIDRSSATERIKLALNSGIHELGIETELTAADIASCRQQQALRGYLGLLRNIHMKQIETLRASINGTREAERFSLSDSRDSFGMVESLPHWSMASQSEAPAESRTRPIKATGEKVLNVRRERLRINEDLISGAKRREERDDAYAKSQAAARVADLEQSLVGQKSTPRLPLNMRLSSSEVFDTERRRKREILHNQLNHMQRTVEELKTRMKDGAVENGKMRSSVAKLQVGNDNCIRHKTHKPDAATQTFSACKGSDDKESTKTRYFSANVTKDTSPATEVEREISSVGNAENSVKAGHFDDFPDSNESCSSLDVVNIGTSGRNEHSNKTVGSKHVEGSIDRKDSVNSSKSTSSSLSQVAHDVTRLVRLSSRRPKGSAD